MSKADYIEENTALRAELADAGAILDAAGIGESARRHSERVAMLVKRERALRAVVAAARAALNAPLFEHRGPLADALAAYDEAVKGDVHASR